MMKLRGLLFRIGLLSQAVIPLQSAKADQPQNSCGAIKVQSITAGRELSILYQGTSADLSGLGPNVARKTCRIAVLLNLPRNSYVGKITQKMTYSYYRSNGAKAQLDLRTWVYPNTYATLERMVPTPNRNGCQLPLPKGRGLWGDLQG